MDFNLTSATRIGLNVLALLGLAIALRLGESIFIPLVISVLLAAILWPAAEWFNRRGLPWGVACLLAVAGLVLLNLVVTLGMILSVPKLIQGLPNLNNPVEQDQFYRQLRKHAQNFSPWPVDEVFPEERDQSQLFRQIQEALRSEHVTRFLLKLLGYLDSWFIQWVLIMFIVLFLLMEGPMLTRRLTQIFGPSQLVQRKAVDALSQIAHSVRSYLVWRTIVNFGLGLLLGLVFHAAGLKHSWTWGILAAILCYIPYIGPILAGIGPVLDALVYTDNSIALGILIFYIVVVTIEGYVIVPLVMGRSMALNATTVMLACLFWDLVWGTPGLFLAMPLMAALKAVCMNVPGWRPWANLMGTEVDTPTENSEPVPTETGKRRFDPDKTVIIEEAYPGPPDGPSSQ
jgi:predicted PurR-regulated permease PerM